MHGPRFSMFEKMSNIRVLLLFGLPCVGKTSLVNEIKVICNEATIFSVDSAIRDLLGHEPCKNDFKIRAKEVLANIEKHILDTDAFAIVEMGCLIPRVHVEAFVAQISVACRVLSVELTCDALHTRQRAIDRNLLVLSGHSDAVIIDNPDEICNFSNVYERPEDIIILESDHVKSEKLAQLFLTQWGFL